MNTKEIIAKIEETGKVRGWNIFTCDKHISLFVHFTDFSSNSFDGKDIEEVFSKLVEFLAL